MTRCKFIVCAILTTFFIDGCSEILEPVSFERSRQGGWMSQSNVKDWINRPASTQEEFAINIEALTFASAGKANQDPYLRQLMLVGSGLGAKVANEADLLTNEIPKKSKKPEYVLGFGDQLSFTQVKEFLPKVTQWPTDLLWSEYLVGVGDELTLIQLNEKKISVSSIINSTGFDDEDDTQDTPAISLPIESIIQVRGLVGTNGNILFLGFGTVKAANRTLNDIQTEVRNILIRNGLDPSFQLEITGFKSKKAFVASPDSAYARDNRSVPLTNIPLTLRELGLNFGLKPASKNTTIITLTRNAQKFSMTAGQLFDSQTPDIFIQDKDQIEIDVLKAETIADIKIGISVGSKGNILLPGIGSIRAINRTLADLHNEIYKRLIKKGRIPVFQIELTKFKSNKAYLITEGSGSKVINLTNSGIHLKELILSNGSSINNNTSLSVVTLLRDGQVYKMTTEEVFSLTAPDIWIQNNDQIEIANLDYKLGQVFALGGAGNAKIVPIDPSKRETLADILFVSGGALSNILAKRSEVYLLRGRSPSIAYHLDARNVSRILVAAKTELRPNDIVFVADRPIISFSRTLAELSPLRILLRDLENGNIP